MYAVDLLGFGWSEKACVSYEGYAIWQEQLSDFIALKAGGQPVVLVGNSLGGYNSLATAARYPRLVRYSSDHLLDERSRLLYASICMNLP